MTDSANHGEIVMEIRGIDEPRGVDNVEEGGTSSLRATAMSGDLERPFLRSQSMSWSSPDSRLGENSIDTTMLGSQGLFRSLLFGHAMKSFSIHGLHF